MPDITRAARSEPEDSRILQALQRVTDAALAYLPVEDLLNELLVRISEILGSDTAAILMLEANGESLAARAAKGIEEEVEQGVRIPVGGGFAGRIAAQARPMIIDDVDHADVLNPILRQKGIRSLLGVPLLVEGRVIGVLHVGTLTPRIFTDEDRDLLQRAADRAALAIEHAQLYEDRRLAETLQRRLLPGELPAMPDLELDHLYHPAAGARAGGDWYDLFRLARGRFAMVVGDVVGHGVSAAAVMAQLRMAVRAYAAEGHPPGTVVELINRLMCDLGPSSMTTLIYAELDPAAESVAVVSAGHPPPLVVGADGTARFLAPQNGVALAASPASTYRAETFPLPTGAMLVLYTDGLVERRGESIDEGLERLRGMAEQAGGGAALRAALLAALPAEPADDIAVVAARFTPLPERIATEWPARKEALADVRHLVRRWLRSCGADETESYDVTVACQEACANAVEHAYGPTRSSFRVEASCEGGTIRLTVRDQGRWRPARGSNRGRGLPLMRALMDTVDVRRSPEGTVVVLERELGREEAA